MWLHTVYGIVIIVVYVCRNNVVHGASSVCNILLPCSPATFPSEVIDGLLIAASFLAARQPITSCIYTGYINCYSVSLALANIWENTACVTKMKNNPSDRKPCLSYGFCCYVPTEGLFKVIQDHLSSQRASLAKEVLEIVRLNCLVLTFFLYSIVTYCGKCWVEIL